MTFARGSGRRGALVRSAIVPFALAILAAGGAAASAQSGEHSAATGGAVAIRGTVVDAASGKPVPGSSVALHRLPDSTVVTGAVTRADGTFTINGVHPGRYVARISGVGYAPYFVKAGVKPGADALDLGTIKLEPGSVSADEVVVNAQRDFMTVAPDRTIYATKDLIVSSGGTATDLLKNIPSVEVDADGNVSLRGNQNLTIQLNGRPSGLTAESLKSLPADAIAQVEIVANPSAKFDPEGTGGIINIVLKQDHDRGVSGGVSGGAGTNGGLSLGGNINYGSGPWNILANYGFTRRPQTNSGIRLQDNFLTSPASSLTSIDSAKEVSLGHSLNASVDYSLDKQNTLSLTSILGLRDGTEPGTNEYTNRTIAGDFLSRSRRASENNEHRFSYDNRLGYKWTGKPKENELSAEIRYSSRQDSNETDGAERTDPMDGTAPAMIQSTHNGMVGRSDEAAVQIDYVRPLWESAHLETGYKGAWRWIDNTFTSDSLNLTTDEFQGDGGSNSFIYHETVHAVYGTLSQDIGAVSFQLGLRAERAITSFDLRTLDQTFDNNYTSLFPSAAFSWHLSDETQIHLSYGKRVNRPRSNQLNPFNTESDRQFHRTGNPYLAPEYAHSLQLDITEFVPWGTITLNPYFTRTVDAIQRFQQFDSTGVVTSTFVNFGRMDSYGAELTSSGKIGEWLTGFANVSVYRMISDASNIQSGFTGDALGWSARANATISFGWGVDLQGNVFYRAPNDVVGGHTGSYGSTDLALQKHLFDDRARLGIKVNDLFNQAGFTYTQVTDTYRIDTERHWSSRAAMLTFSYTFGQMDARARQKQRAAQQSGGDDDGGGW